MMASKVFDIHVFIPDLNCTLYAHTYEGFADAPAAKRYFLSVNQEREPQHVFVTERPDTFSPA